MDVWLCLSTSVAFRPSFTSNWLTSVRANWRISMGQTWGPKKINRWCCNWPKSVAWAIQVSHCLNSLNGTNSTATPRCTSNACCSFWAAWCSSVCPEGLTWCWVRSANGAHCALRNWLDTPKRHQEDRFGILKCGGTAKLMREYNTG